jgi:hypothetical protein
MANPVIINPTLTLAGQIAAFNASGTGLELNITHVSYGTDHYDPTGDEIALRAPVGIKIPVAGASRPTPTQIRMVSVWHDDVGDVPVGEIGFWADDTLVFVWSKADGAIASYKTNGVAYVLFNDLTFSSVPANSISFTVDPNESVALAALVAHEGASNAHPQYVLRAKFPDYQGHLWGDVGGTANAIELTLPAIVELTGYIKGNRFSFKATATNTGDTTINVEGVGPVQVLKTGGLALSAGSIVADGVYDVYYDGAKFQLTAGAGFASAEATTAEVTGTTAINSTSWVSVRRLLEAMALKANLAGPTFTGTPNAPTATALTSSTQIATTAFVYSVLINTMTKSVVGGVDITLSTTEAKYPIFRFVGALTANINIIVPSGANAKWAIVNNTSGAYTLTVKTASSPGVTVAQGQSRSVLIVDTVTLISANSDMTNVALTGLPTAPTAAPGTNTNQVANTAFVSTALANLVASSPAALDTLNELAAALGNDPNFATTVTNALAGKVATSDKATQLEAETGTDNTKWMTPLRASQAISKVVATEIFSDATAGATTVTLPAANKPMDVVVRRVDNTGNRLVVQAAGTDKVLFHTHLRPEGYSFFVLMGAGDFWYLRSDGAGHWRLLYRLNSESLGRPVFETTTAFSPGGWGGINNFTYNRADWPWLWDHAQASGMLTTEAARTGMEGGWTSGDGALTFRVPEGRAEFWQVLDEGRGVDVGRAAGSWKASDNKAHNHALSGAGNYGTQMMGGGSVTYAQWTAGSTASSGGAEARPRSIAYPGRFKMI